MLPHGAGASHARAPAGDLTGPIPDVLAISTFPAPATTSTTPTRHELSWPELVAMLTTHRRLRHKDGAGWSPATYMPGTTRKNENVRAISCFGADRDHATLAELEAVVAELVGLGLAHIIYSTYSNAPPDALSFRVVIPFARPIVRDESDASGAGILALWGSVWRNATHHAMGGRNDEQTKDLARFFYVPSAPEGVAVFHRAGDGLTLDWEALPTAPVHVPEPAADGEVSRGAIDHLGYQTLDFLANGAPEGEQRSRALGATRALLASGYSVEETARKVFRALEESPCGKPDEPWTHEHALAFAKDLAGRKPTPLPEYHDLEFEESPAEVHTNGKAPLPAAEATDAAEPMTLAAAAATFKRWLYLDDVGLIYAVLAAVAANKMAGDPVWLVVVGAPSGGKTEVLNAISSLPNIHMAATLTEAALLSGTPKRDKAKGARGGLLRTIGDFGILLCKDFTSVLSMNRDTRAILLAALREIYDGSWTRHVGIDGGQTLSWSGKLGLIAGCTTTIDSHHAVMATMGERFLLYRLPEIDPAEQGKRALANTGREGEMRRELSAAVAGLFAGLELPESPPTIDEDETRRLVALASLAARCRSAVERDRMTREIELIPDPEAPARIAQGLRRLYGGLIAIGLDRPAAWPIVVKVGLDCMPKLRRSVFEYLAVKEDWQSTAAVATDPEVAYPTVTARRALEDLMVHGIVERKAKGKDEGEDGGDGRTKPDYWRLSSWARERYDKTFSAMSVVEERSADSLTTANRMCGDIAEKVGGEAAP